MKQRDVAKEEAHIREVLGSKRFLNMEGLGNEVPFFIWAYPPSWEVEAEQAAARLRKNLATSQGLTVVDVDLFDLAIGLLEARGVLEQLVELEPRRGPAQFQKDLQRMLDPAKHIVPAIKARLDEQGAYDVLFLTGIGKVFPFIRSHNVLNTLQTVASHRPMLMFFPGEYRQSQTLGSALVLFGQLPDDQYYRAKNILEQEPS